MSFSARQLPAVLFAFLSLTVSLSAQSTSKQANKVSRGSVSGRVTIREKPAAGVAVGVRKGETSVVGEPFLKTTTDPNGSYYLTNLAPGSYSVTVSAPGFVTVNTGGRLKTVLVGEDETVEGIDFALIRGGAITGRVTDAEGNPVIEQQVNVYSVQALAQRSQQRQVFPSGGARTDDRGIYRIFGLYPGRYKVAAGRSSEELDVFSAPTRSISYKQVFHPDVPDHAKAAVIEVSEGSDAGNVDIVLGRALQTFSVSGQIIDGEKGLPIPNLRFGVQRTFGQRVEYMNVFGLSNSRGDFAIEGLIPGKYGVYLQPNQTGGMRAEPITFDVVDHDLSDLLVRVVNGASVRGVVMLEKDDKNAIQKLFQLQLRAFVSAPQGSAIGSSSATSPIGPDGSFYLAGLGGGRVNLSLAAVMGAVSTKGFTIKRIERDGAVPKRELEIKEGEQLSGVCVIISYGSAILRGVVKFENGAMPPGRVAIRVTKPDEPKSTFRSPLVDERGHFLMEGLAAGTYVLQAIILNSDPSQRRMITREVTVQDDEISDVTITFDLSAPKQP